MSERSYFPSEEVSWRAILVCLLAAFFYLYEFVLQVSPGVITEELMRDFQVDALGLGWISSFYFYSYTPTQLPAGLLFDRYGPRVLITFAIVWCSLGSLFLSGASSAAVAAFGRFAMGFGSAFSFIGSLVLIGRWLPARYFAPMTGVVEMLSCVGAIFGEFPLSIAAHRYGWRHCFVFLGWLGLLLAGVTWMIVRDAPHTQKTERVRRPIVPYIMEQFRKVLSQSQNRLIALYAFCSWAPLVTFAHLWGVPYLKLRYGVSTEVASEYCSLIWVGLAIGCPLFGWWSERVSQRLPFLIGMAVVGLLSVGSMYVPHVSKYVMWVILFFMGIAASGQSLTFAMVRETNVPQTLGTALGFNNMATVLGGAVLQPLVGSLLRWHWDGTILDRVPVYQLSHYETALWVLPLCYGVGLGVSLWGLKESHPGRVR